MTLHVKSLGVEVVRSVCTSVFFLQNHVYFVWVTLILYTLFVRAWLTTVFNFEERFTRVLQGAKFLATVSFHTENIALLISDSADTSVTSP